jgi:hypothetical protein
VFVALFVEDEGEVLTSKLHKLGRLDPTLYRF